MDLQEERYLYFRMDSTIGNDDDSTNGSNVWPASSLKGMTMGAATIAGGVAESENVFSLLFKPMALGDGYDDVALSDDVDDVLCQVATSVNNPAPAMQAIVRAINEKPHSDGWIEIFDAVTGTKIHPSISAISVLKAASSD